MSGIAEIGKPFWKKKDICKKLTPEIKEYLWGREEWILSSLQKGLEGIPIMVKIIQAKKPLSIQVHPDDTYAKAKEESPGKTEMWYILECEKEAFLYYGLKHRISREELQKRIQNQTITEVCNKVKVKKGDVYFVPAGMLHAIGRGLTLAEVQQNSNLTYRLYDYGRKDENNHLRPLHLEKAKDVMEYHPSLFKNRPMVSRREREGGYETLLTSCPFFRVTRLEIKGLMKQCIVESFQFLYVADGSISLFLEKEELELNQGENLFLSGRKREYRLKGRAEVLLIEP